MFKYNFVFGALKFFSSTLVHMVVLCVNTKIQSQVDTQVYYEIWCVKLGVDLGVHR